MAGDATILGISAKYVTNLVGIARNARRVVKFMPCGRARTIIFDEFVLAVQTPGRAFRCVSVART